MHPMSSLRLVALMVTAIVHFPKLTGADTTFDLWAYGSSDGVGACSFFNRDGNIILSNTTDHAGLTPVYLSRTDETTGSWTVYKNETDSSGSRKVLGQLALPNLKEVNEVVIVDQPNSTYRLGDFRLYGNTAFAKEDEKWRNLFYASGTDILGVWDLVWDPENAADGNFDPVVLRDVMPF